MNEIERESIILETAWRMIDGMVNWAVFEKPGTLEPTNLRFQTYENAKLFSILLGDFLSQVTAFKGNQVPLGLNAPPRNAPDSDRTFLFHLRQVCIDPRLGRNTTALSESVEVFAKWLEGEFVAKGVNLAPIGRVVDLRIKRLLYLKMCGDIAKHSLARLEANAKRLVNLLEKAGEEITEQQAYIAIESFFEWFHEDILVYHSSRIAEFLNNIRWEINEYVKPEFERSFHLKDAGTLEFPVYGYSVPHSIREPVAYEMYWSLMNRCRFGPIINRFVVSDSFKSLY